MIVEEVRKSLPPGKFVAELWGYKVGETIRNHFHRKARVAYLYEADNGQKFLLYAYDSGFGGVQLLQTPKPESEGARR
jgi:hypothetical protein